MTTVLDTVLEAEKNAAEMIAQAESKAQSGVKTAEQTHVDALAKETAALATAKEVALHEHAATLEKASAEAAKKAESEVTAVREHFSSKHSALVALVKKNLA